MVTGLRLFAAVLVAQLSLMAPPPGVLAVGGDHGQHSAHGSGDIAASLACSGHALSPDAREALGALAAALNLAPAHDAPGHHDHDEHCPACALAKAMAMPQASALPVFDAPCRLVRAAPRMDRASPRQTAGPPVGLRAPPLTV